MRRDSWSPTLAFLSLASWLFSPAACSKASSSNQPTPNSGATTVLVHASEGAVLSTSQGIALEIPPGALARDTQVTLTPLADSDLAPAPGAVQGLFLAGAIIDPDGTRLAAPASLRMRLPADWADGELPAIWQTRGSDPAWALPSTFAARLEGTPGANVAVAEVGHFSSWIASTNCHGGTVKRLLAHYAARGCSREQTLAKVNARFGGGGAITVSEDNARSSTPPAVQAVLDTYFDDFATFDAGQDVPAATLAELTQHVLQGRQVVLAFSGGAAFPSRTAANGFFPSNSYAHSCVVESDGGGGVQMHHTVVRPRLMLDPAAMRRLLDDLGGELQYVYPFADLNEYRSLKQGVALERAVCGTPGCFSDPTLNRYGLAPYGPVDGDDVHPPRLVPYPNVHIYLEKPEAVTPEFCGASSASTSFPDPTGDWTFTLTLFATTRLTSTVNPDPASYVGQWVEVVVAGYPLNSGSWDPLFAKLAAAGGSIRTLRIYRASNSWDPGSRVPAYIDIHGDQGFSLAPAPYYWLYVWTDDPDLPYSYTTQIIALKGGQ